MAGQQCSQVGSKLALQQNPERRLCTSSALCQGSLARTDRLELKARRRKTYHTSTLGGFRAVYQQEAHTEPTRTFPEFSVRDHGRIPTPQLRAGRQSVSTQKRAALSRDETSNSHLFVQPK